MANSINPSTEKWIMIKVNLGDEDFVEVIKVKKEISNGIIEKEINDYVNSDEWQEREADYEVIEHLIKKWIILDTLDYEYLNV